MTKTITLSTNVPKVGVKRYRNFPFLKGGTPLSIVFLLFLSLSFQISNAQKVYKFTPCGATGKDGPTQNQCNSEYGNGVVTVSNGIQLWTVPASGKYHIVIAGAS